MASWPILVHDDLLPHLPTATLSLATVVGLGWHFIYLNVIFKTTFIEFKKAFFILLVIYEFVALTLFANVPFALWQRAFVFPSISIFVCMDVITSLNSLLYLRMCAIHSLRWPYLVNYFHKVVPGATLVMVLVITGSRYVYLLSDIFQTDFLLHLTVQTMKCCRLTLSFMVAGLLARETSILRKPDADQQRNELFIVDFGALVQSTTVACYTAVAQTYFELHDFYPSAALTTLLIIVYPYIINLSFLLTNKSLWKQWRIVFSRKSRPKLSAIYSMDERDEPVVVVKPLDVISLSSI